MKGLRIYFDEKFKHLLHVNKSEESKIYKRFKLYSSWFKK